MKKILVFSNFVIKENCRCRKRILSIGFILIGVKIWGLL